MNTLELLLSVFISPWQFFKESVPSTRVELNLLKSLDDQNNNWQEFSLRPDSISFLGLIKSLFYNSKWNESIYIMDCAERLLLKPNYDDENEIMQRLRNKLGDKEAEYLQFRLIFVTKSDSGLEKNVLFISKVEGIDS